MSGVRTKPDARLRTEFPGALGASQKPAAGTPRILPEMNGESDRQTTTRSAVRFAHRALRSGRAAAVRLRPAPADTGIVFNDRIPARLDDAFTDEHTVGLGRNGERIVGVEHVLAACYGLGIDNLFVDVEGGEVPFGDGSALPFARILQAAGMRRCSRPRRTLKLARPCVVNSGDSLMCALPWSPAEVRSGPAERGMVLSVSYYVRFPDPEIGEQFCETMVSSRSFVRELAGARTFGVLPPGVILPAWLGRVTCTGGGNLLPARARFPDEPARHKVLDFVGDLTLLGRRLSAQVLAYRAGHRLHHELLREMEDECKLTR